MRYIKFFVLFITPVFCLDLFILDGTGVKNIVFNEDQTVVTASAEQVYGYDITRWSAGVYLPFGRYKLLPYLSVIDSPNYYTESTIWLNNLFLVYAPQRSSFYLILLPKLVIRTYGKELVESGDPVFVGKQISKFSFDTGLVYKFSFDTLSTFETFFIGVYISNVNRPNFGVIESDVIKPETVFFAGGLFSFYGVKVLPFVERVDGDYRYKLSLNFGAEIGVEKSDEMLSYFLGVEIKKVFLFLRYKIFEFSSYPQLAVEFKF